MEAGEQVRITTERRLRPDRRRGLDRRLGPRRLRFQWVEVEQRASLERRRAERRAAAPRRRGNGRLSGPEIITLPPF